VLTHVQRARDPAATDGPSRGAPESVLRTLSTPGQSAETLAGAGLEGIFRHDFSSIRVHADDDAAASARDLGAAAYTVGAHVVFAPGQYAPHTTEGRRLLAHELVHVIQQGGSSGVTPTAELRIEPPSSAAEGEAHDVAAGRSSADSVRPRMGGPRIQRQLELSRDPFEDNDRFLKLVRQIGSFGLPIKFLPPLARGFGIYMNSRENMTVPFLRSINLEASTSEELEKYLSPQGKVGESIALMNLYHECTHAFLMNLGRDEQLAKVVRRGISYYKNAPMDKGRRTASDPERVFHEAAASYVGHRVQVYWSALESLVPDGQATLASAPQAGRIGKFLDRVEKTRQRYDSDISERVFGYEPQDGRESETTKAISPELKAYLDARVLEGEMPDHFDEVPAFQRIVDGVVQIAAGQGR
jgi:hypothetical protein